MEQITLKYDAHNAIAKKALDLILSLNVFTVEDEEKCPYNPEFVEKIERSRKSTGRKIELEDLWK